MSPGPGLSIDLLQARQVTPEELEALRTLVQLLPPTDDWDDPESAADAEAAAEVVQRLVERVEGTGGAKVSVAAPSTGARLSPPRSHPMRDHAIHTSVHTLLSGLEGMHADRRVVGVADDTRRGLTVACGDGAVFWLPPAPLLEGSRWVELPPVPGTPEWRRQQDTEVRGADGRGER